MEKNLLLFPPPSQPSTTTTTTSSLVFCLPGYVSFMAASIHLWCAQSLYKCHTEFNGFGALYLPSITGHSNDPVALGAGKDG